MRDSSSALYIKPLKKHSIPPDAANHLQQGDRIHIEGLGYFQLSVTAPVVEDPKKMRGDYISVKTVNFLPERKLVNRLKSIKFERAKRRLHSAEYTNEEIENKLDEYFQEHTYITRSDFQELCGFTKTTALRKLKALVEAKKLRKKGNLQLSVYEKGNSEA